MKKTLIVFLSLFLFFTVSPIAFAKDVIETPSGFQIEKVQYDLPYPGILPDNPLYFLKAIRDNVFGFFISDPLKIADFDLLQADKRLGSAKALFDKGNIPLSITTLSKSGNYFEKAIAFSEKAKTQGRDANPIIDRLLVSSKKHEQIIYDMQKSSKGDNANTYSYYLERTIDFQKRLEELKSK